MMRTPRLRDGSTESEGKRPSGVSSPPPLLGLESPLKRIFASLLIGLSEANWLGSLPLLSTQLHRGGQVELRLMKEWLRGKVLF